MVFDGSSDKRQIFVRGLTPSTNEKLLELAFSKFGPIEGIIVPKDRETRDSKGFGFLTFVSPEDAADAIKGMDGKDVNGGTLTVEEATERRSSDRDKRGPPPSFKSYDDRGFGGRDVESRGYMDRGRGGFRGGRGSRGGRDSDRGGRDFGSRGRGRGMSRDGGFSRGRGRDFSRDDDRGFSRDRGGGRGSSRGFSRDGGRGGSRGGGGFRGSRGSSPRGSFREGPSRFRDDSRGPRGPPRDMDSRDKYRDSFGSGGREMGGYSNGAGFRDSFSSRDAPKDYGDRNDRYGASRGGSSYDSYPTSRGYDSAPPSRDYGSSRSSGYDSRDGGFSGSSTMSRDYGGGDRFGGMPSRYEDQPSRGPSSRYDDPPPSRYDDGPRGPPSRYDDPPRGPPSSRDGPYDSYSTSGGRGFDGGSRGPPPSRSLSSGPPTERGFGRGPPREDRGPRSLSRDDRGPRGPSRDDRGPPRGPPRDGPSRGPPRDGPPRGPPRDDSRRERRMPRDMDDGPPVKRPRGDGPPSRGRGSFRGGPRR